MITGAIAIFVKTIGLSPIKTRLARGIGSAAAETFHRLSCQATAAVVRQAAERMTPYWAVAEPAGIEDPGWQNFPQIFQGEGELGTRLDRVYRTLLQSHSFVLLLGADSPQISALTLLQAATWAGQGQFVIGLAADGGFYLFGGAQAIPRSVWESVPYSKAETAKTLINALASNLTPLGIQQLPTSFDVDTVQDLQQLQRELATIVAQEQTVRAEILPEQLILLDWINHLFCSV